MRTRDLQDILGPSGRARKAQAFSSAELLVIISCLALLVVIFLPALPRFRARSYRGGINCANNMRQIGLAFHTWAIDNRDRFPMQVPVTEGGTRELVDGGVVFPHFQVMSNELSTARILLCPEDTRRNWATNFSAGFSDKNISYFVNMDSTNGAGASLLAGDRNLTNRAARGSRLVYLTKPVTLAWDKQLHSQQGYLLFGDGSVNQFNNRNVSAAIQLQEGVTNRLAIP